MTALTIGKFESIHRGHQRLITETVDYAKQNNLTSTVVTFDPHPRQFLTDPCYCPLFTMGEREFVLHSMGVDRIFAYPFDAGFATQTPEEFCQRLFDGFPVQALFVGEGYRFGHKRAGNVETIQAMAHTRGIYARVLRHAVSDSKKISTSDIRACIHEGKLQEAGDLLGFPFFIAGNVARGKMMGNILGFPTVNIIPPVDKFLPPHGVYATRVFTGKNILNGVTNVGTRPTVNDGTHQTVETFLIGFDEDIYGENLRIDFIRFLRPERKFDTLDELRGQIAKDVKAAWEGTGNV
jgi:riboflavin kinase/FMN adenylyltransferase